MSNTNKLKILNDPIYGFITIPNALIFDLVEHPYFQRLRRISQLGLTYLVYPGAYHTRFHHALGAMHLMQKAVAVLRSKGQSITNEEEEAVYIAILLHDIGHGPFSHALESALVPDLGHESLSLQFMEALNERFEGQLSLGIQIFKNQYHKGFLHQLISSQLDMDRLDYLRRDCFYTGVSEGRVNTERLLSMLNVKDDQIVVEAKGIYSVEKFLVARRLMYWQVYLHKTVLSAEYLLIQILKRAKAVLHQARDIPLVLAPFFQNNLAKEGPALIEAYARVDDHDVMAAIKTWQYHSDVILSNLCQRLLDRKLLGVQVSDRAPSQSVLNNYRKAVAKKLLCTTEEAAYLVFSEAISNNAYSAQSNNINLLYRDGSTVDIAQAADLLNISALAAPVTKFFLFAPKAILASDGR